MKVAISATGDRLESDVDSRFGRCPYFIVIDTSDMSYKAFANTHADFSSGAGIQSAGFLADEGVQAVLTGNCGPKASQVFAAAGINVFTGYAGTVKGALKKFQQQGDAGQSATKSTGRPVAADMPQTPGAMGGRRGGIGGGGGTGMGRGRGMGGGGGGRCMGGGRGMGGARGMSGVMAPSCRPGPSEKGTLTELKQQADQLKQQKAAIEKKLKD